MPILRSRTLPPLLVILVLVGAILVWPQPVGAQCGTQASSCKNCHEVQAQDPVNTEGDWHTQHAFGDFCQFCHAGNVAATDKDAAHEGLIHPLGDPQGSCSACHPNDYQDSAQVYATSLGIDLASVESAPVDSEPAAPDANSDNLPAEEPPAESVTDVQIIDLNERYEDKTFAPRRVALNTGNIILTAMLVGLVGIFGVLIWKFEGLDKRWVAMWGVPIKTASNGHTTAAILTESPALAKLVPVLEKASPVTLASLSKLLESDPGRGGQIIEALARIDSRLVEAVRRLSERDMELLVALVRELNERR